ncbi:hypothetical protein [Novosphingopyxis sp.]|uniref:hypothetical protein n=1 Tax=Novosphingopyxis sp. TaxID=2709690 RepID=UPI003B5935E7
MWIMPWSVQSGPVSRLRVGPHRDLFDGAYTLRETASFLVDGVPVEFGGPSLPLRDGDRAVVVGWRLRDGLTACFVALPGRARVFQPYSATGTGLVGLLLLFIAAWCLARGPWPLGLVAFGLSAILLFQAAAWLDGRALARRGLERLSN